MAFSLLSTSFHQENPEDREVTVISKLPPLPIMASSSLTQQKHMSTSTSTLHSPTAPFSSTQWPTPTDAPNRESLAPKPLSK